MMRHGHVPSNQCDVHRVCERARYRNAPFAGLVPEEPDDRLAKCAACCLDANADAPPPVAERRDIGRAMARTSKCCRCCCCCCLSLLFFDSKSLTRKVGQTAVLSLRRSAGAPCAQCCVLGCGWRSLAAYDRHAGCGSRPHDQCARQNCMMLLICVKTARVCRCWRRLRNIIFAVNGE